MINDKKIKLAYLVTHPIQYQAPLLTLLAKDPTIDLKVFFCSDFSISEYFDKEFGKNFSWDVPLLEGYQYEFLPALGDNKQVAFFKPWNYGLFRRLRKGKFDVLWVHGYAKWFHWVSILGAKLLGIKVLIRDESTNFSARRGRIKIFLKKVFFRILNLFVDGFLAIGSLNAEYYRTHGISAHKIFSAPYTVDNAFFQEKIGKAHQYKAELKKSLGIPEHATIILYASKLTKRKCATDLLEAYIELFKKEESKKDRPYLLIIGEGEEKPKIGEKISQLNWDTVVLLGFKNQTELPAYYDLADIFVLPSYHEPWGLVINEAMNAKCAIIASREVGSAVDLVKHRYNGMLFEAGNTDDFKQALSFTLAHYSEMGEKSFEIINQWSFTETIQGIKSACRVLTGADNVKA